MGRGRLVLVLAALSVSACERPIDGLVGTPRLAVSSVDLQVAWPNAWRNERNYDAVWVVIRDLDAPEAGPVRLDVSGGMAWSSESDCGVRIGEGGTGFLVYLDEPGRGDVRLDLSLPLLEPERRYGELRAYALEMVLVPGGPYELGDDHADARALGSFWRANADGRPAGTYRVESEDAIEVAAGAGSLDYDPGEHPEYRGDRGGPIPAGFPKGVRPFFVMKYELRQGQYADFLNALPEAWRARRAPLPAPEDPSLSLVCAEDGTWSAGAPDRPANFVSWDDTAAFADWMGLRPLSELEFEKAARGPRRPVPLDHPWGTADSDALLRLVGDARDLAHSDAQAERGLSDATRAEHGASWCWVFDLSGSLWERVVCAGNPRGRAYLGSHGDGVLDERGDATNPDWPRGGPDGQEAEGIGYRGGAQYFDEPNGTNPYSPVGVRTYAAWNGAMRRPTYSARACLTVPWVDELGVP